MSSLNLKPLDNRIIVRVMRESQTIAGGTLHKVEVAPDPDLPANPEPAHGEIVAVGPEVSKYTPGQIVLYPALSAAGVFMEITDTDVYTLEDEHDIAIATRKGTLHRSIYPWDILAIDPDFKEPTIDLNLIHRNCDGLEYYRTEKK